MEPILAAAERLSKQADVCLPGVGLGYIILQLKGSTRVTTRDLYGYYSIGALIIRTGFGVSSTIIIKRNFQSVGDKRSICTRPHMMLKFIGLFTT